MTLRNQLPKKKSYKNQLFQKKYPSCNVTLQSKHTLIDGILKCGTKSKRGLSGWSTTLCYVRNGTIPLCTSNWQVRELAREGRYCPLLWTANNEYPVYVDDLFLSVVENSLVLLSDFWLKEYFSLNNIFAVLRTIHAYIEVSNFCFYELNYSTFKILP